MRLSDLRRLLDEEFGPGYAPTVAADHRISGLGSRTADEAVADGAQPRTVWLALCDDFEVPESRRLGRDRPLRRDAPLD